MVVHLDTSLLIHAWSHPERQALVGDAIAHGDRLNISSLVLYEWLRGPRSPEELALTDAFFPPDSVIPFDDLAARLAARLYRTMPRAKPRQADLAIAACAISHDAALWTLNPADFEDIPELTLYQP